MCLGGREEGTRDRKDQKLAVKPKKLQHDTDMKIFHDKFLHTSHKMDRGQGRREKGGERRSSWLLREGELLAQDTSQKLLRNNGASF